MFWVVPVSVFQLGFCGNRQCSYTLQVYNQSAEDGAISLTRAATDPSLTGQGFKYFGAWYKGPLLIHTGNESKSLIRSCFTILQYSFCTHHLGL